MTTRYQPSSARHPCPVCDRTHDGDCRILEASNLILCHTYQADCYEGQHAGYKFLRHSNKGAGWGVWVWNQRDERGRLHGRKGERSLQRQEFIYQSRDGQPIARTTKVPNPTKPGNKQFYQSHWDGQQWVNKIPSAIRPAIPIYRYAEVRTAIASGDPIWIVEGEQKADALWELGIPATCFLGGCKGYRSYGNYAQDLAGAKLVLCPDRDKEGVDFMEQLRTSYPDSQWAKVYPTSPIWDNLPDDHGLDIVDWISDGATKADILAAIVQSPKTEPPPRSRADYSYQDFLAEVQKLVTIADSDELSFYKARLARNFGYRIEQIDDLIRRKFSPDQAQKKRIYDLHELRDIPELALHWLVPGILPRGEALLMSSEAKQGKTLLSDDLIFAIATGEDDWLGETVQVDHGRVLKVTVDESLRSTLTKAEKRYGPQWVEPGRVHLIDDWKITELDWLKAQILNFQPDLVVIDSLRQVASNLGISENSAEFVDHIAGLIKWCNQQQISLIVIHHDNKNKESHGIDRARGSSSLVAAFWGVIRLEPCPVEKEEGQGKSKKKVVTYDPEDTKRLFSLTARDSMATQFPIELQLEDHHWIRLSSEKDAEAESVEKRILSLLRVNTAGLTPGELLTMMDAPTPSKSALYKALDTMTARRILSKLPSKSQSKGRPAWVYQLPPPSPSPPRLLVEKVPIDSGNDFFHSDLPVGEGGGQPLEKKATDYGEEF